MLPFPRPALGVQAGPGTAVQRGPVACIHQDSQRGHSSLSLPRATIASKLFRDVDAVRLGGITEGAYPDVMDRAGYR